MDDFGHDAHDEAPEPTDEDWADYMAYLDANNGWPPEQDRPEPEGDCNARP